MSKKVKRTIIIVVIVVLVLGCAGGGFAVYSSKNVDPVKVFSISDVGMTEYWGDSSTTSGQVSVDNMQSVYVSSTQKVKEIYVQEGQEVKAGDPLIAFDTTLSDLELEKQRITVEKTNSELSKEQANLKKINTYVPYVPPAPTPEPEPEPLEPMSLPLLEKGSGTQSNPYIYLWNDSCWYTNDFIDKIIPLEPDGQTPDTPDNPDAPDTPDNPDDPDSSDEPDSTARTNGTTYKSNTAYVIFEVRDYDNTKGDLQRYWGMVFTRNTDGTYKFSMYEPSADYAGDDDTTSDTSVIDTPVSDQPTYTAAEIAQMKSESQKRIKDLTLQLKMEQVKYKKLQLELETGIVTAELDGIIKTVGDPDAAQGSSTPIIVLSGGGGYYIQGTLSELELETVKVGQQVSIYCYSTGVDAMGEIVEISDQPAADNSGWTNGNQNVSYYNFKVFVSEDAALQANDYAEITYSSTGESSSVYLEMPFVLSENGKSYVYIADENGLLEKREVQTGKTVWGSYIEILSGVTADDYVAFPYGKGLTDGVPTRQATYDELYEGLY